MYKASFFDSLFFYNSLGLRLPGQCHLNTRIVAYNVSGEYAMLKNAVKNGIVDEVVIYETLIAIKRAGAKNIITYHAKDIAKQCKEGSLELN